jgi:uncharacterized protein with NAD-binding domain and iron-sulfur cluster
MFIVAAPIERARSFSPKPSTERRRDGEFVFSRIFLTHKRLGFDPIDHGNCKRARKTVRTFLEPMGKERIKVAIIGGGCASMATAFELSRPEHDGKYEITIYQMGWRLGGKGASGRGPANRIEEHGFHVWLGMYENSFRLIRECYAALGRDRKKFRIADWRDAFFPAPFIGLTGRGPGGQAEKFISYFPPHLDGLPGDPLDRVRNPFTVSSYLLRIVFLVRTIILTSAVGPQNQSKGAGISRDASASGPKLDDSQEDTSARIAKLAKLGMIAGTAGVIEALALLESFLRSEFAGSEMTILPFVEQIARSIRALVEEMVARDPHMSLVWDAIDLGTTAIAGIIRSGLLSDPRGFDAINDCDFREWMRLNGASDQTLSSPFVRGCYDLVFGYEDGDVNKPRLAAGVALRGTMRMLFTYRGAIFWKMRAGMGDVVFAPLYELLKRRGVSFRFFHRLQAVRLSKRSTNNRRERQCVRALEFDIQAEVADGEYRPLVHVNGLPCWPSKPIYSQLADGVQLKARKIDLESHWNRGSVGKAILEVGRDFDLVVLGIGLGALSGVCREMVRQDRRWRDMLTNLKTVETQAFQLWMTKDMRTLGWNGPPVSLSGFEHPFETWADMSHLSAQESWRRTPRSIAYFCGPLRENGRASRADEDGYEARRRRQVRQNAVRFLNRHAARLWPRAVRKDGSFRWDWLADASGEFGKRHRPSKVESRFDSQYWCANVNPSDRYVLSLPGTPRFRISPLDTTYRNLVVAGDWTATGLDSGCVESAVISGMLAAHAISGLPKLEDIVGYDHP